MIANSNCLCKLDATADFYYALNQGRSLKGGHVPPTFGQVTYYLLPPNIQRQKQCRPSCANIMVTLLLEILPMHKARE